jgi:hypothetical protein
VLVELHVRSDFRLKEDGVQCQPLFQVAASKVRQASIAAGLCRAWVEGIRVRVDRTVTPVGQMTWELEDRDLPMRYLVHDHDTRFTGLFDTVFESEGIEVVTIPYEAPNANALAKRWARSVREECLDRLIILNERHLRRVLIVYLAYYNARRPHQGLDRDRLLGLEPVSIEGPIRYRDVLGGIIRDYYREAA